MKHFKQTLALLLVLAFTLVCFTSCTVEAESIALSQSTLTINVGSASSVSATILPEDTTDKTVEWSSSDSNVAIVNNVGVITGVNAGTCVITAKCGQVSTSLTVTVKKPVEQVVLNKSEVTIKVEETFTFKCTVVPNDASEKTISWISTDTSVATVDADGTITGLEAGECVITATCDGKTVSANITVKEKGPNLKAIYQKYCMGKSWADVASDGTYLDIDDNPYNFDDYYSSEADDAIKEIHKEMGLPSSLYNDMLQTTWSMGKQTETFEDVGVKVSWTYHPNKGLEITYKLINP